MTQLTGFKTDRIGSYIEHDPDATLDYTMDWSDWLSSGDPLDTVIWRVSTITGDPAPMTLGSNTTNTITGVSTVLVSGGSAGNVYTLTCRITTDNGLIDERFFRLFAKNRTL
jgi:hypothetical protein